MATAVAQGDLSKKITVTVSGEILELKETINTMVDQLNGFAGEVTRVAREVGTEGRLGGQAGVLGVAGTWKDLTELGEFQMAGNLTAQVRNIAEVLDCNRQWRLVAKNRGGCERRNPAAEGNAEHNGRSAQPLRLGGDARCARSWYRRQARRAGAGARCGRNMEGSDGERQLHGVEPRPGRCAISPGNHVRLPAVTFPARLPST